MSNSIPFTTFRSVTCWLTWWAVPLKSSTVFSSASTVWSIKNIDSPVETWATNISKPATSAASENLAKISSIFNPVNVNTSSPDSDQS